MENITKLDHIIIASPNLKSLAKEFNELTGIKPLPGGSHEGKGTANELIGLGEGKYIELIGPDPSQEEPNQPRPLRVDEIDKTTVVGWAVRPFDIRKTVSESLKSGYDPGDIRPMTRKTLEGEVLSWELTPLDGGMDGTIPFLINWKDTKHPSKGIPDVKLISFKITHPKAGEVRKALKAIGALDLVTEICEGEMKLEIELDTPKGKVIFS